MRTEYDYHDQERYISQAKNIDANIQTVVDLLRLCNEEGTNIKSVVYDVPKVQKTICKNALEEQVIRMLEHKEKLTKELEELMRLKNELFSVVTSVPDNEARICLRMVYLENQSMKSFADRVGMSLATAYRKKEDAVRMIRIPHRAEDR